MICSNCGTENPPGGKFCMECASPLGVACPNCATTNPAGAKFCSECATPLAGGGTVGRSASSAVQPIGSSSEPVSERRLVSVLFADLVGFTPFAEERDSEEVRETLSRYFDVAADIVRRYGGTVEKFIGDAVMAVWGTPTAREDDAERAVRAALELVDAVRGIGDGVNARAGVLTGEAAVTLGATNQGMVAGDLVNTAARLQSVAPPGAVLVGEATHRAASSAIAFEPVGEQSLKGKGAPVAAWRALRVVAERGGRGRSETLEAPFVGREDELRLLKELFHATEREGRARLVSITGAGGIGKSRLAWEFEKYLDGIVGSAWWHRGRSPSYGEGVTFWSLGEMIRGRAGLAEEDDEPTTRAAIARMLAEHVPDEAERGWIEPAMLSLLGIETGIGAQQLFGAWRTFFERMSAVSPVIMVFEDLHWADQGTLDFIDHMQEWSRNVPIFLITLARPELLERRPDWGAGKRSFTSIHLEPLAIDSMRALLVGLVPGLPTAARDSIIERADGVPLYAVETVRMLIAQGRLVAREGVYAPTDDLTELAIPETLTALIAARLDELDASDRSLVADAAVLGQTFTLAALAAVSGSEPDLLEPRVRGLVRRELLVHLVDPRSPERGQFGFVQALIREVAYNTLSRRDRKSRHLAAARFFETLETDELAGALASHYLAAQSYAADGPEADALAAQARVALRGAAERAAGLGSHAQAIAFLEQALAVSPDATDRADLHHRAWTSAMQGLVGEVAERHGLAALEAQRELGDRNQIALATAAYAEAIVTLGTDNAPAIELLLRSWEEFSDLERTPAGVALMLQLAIAHRDVDDAAELAWVERLLPIAERLDLTSETAAALAARSGTLFRLNRPRESLILLRGTNAFAVANGIVDVDRQSRTTLTFLEQFADPGAGLAMAREGLEIAARRGSLGYGFQMVGNAVSCAIRVGEWAWATALLDEWLANEITGSFYLELFVDRAVLTALTGGDPAADLSEAETLLVDVRDPQYTSYCHWGRAWEAFSAGRFEDAQREATSAAAATNYFVPIAVPLAARSALGKRSLPDARSLVQQLETSVARGQAVGLDLVTLRAGVAALEGRGAEASAGYRDALRGWRSLGLAFDEAMAGLDMALLLDPSDAEVRAAAGAARDTFSRLRARPFLARLDAAIGSTPTVLAPASGVTSEESGVPLA